MILVQETKQDVITAGNQVGTRIGIDTSKEMKLKYLLSQGLYQRKEESVCREICSNIIDSYVNSGKSIMDFPGYVILTDKEIVFTDAGSGMSEQFIQNIYCNFLASSKEDDPDSIG